MNHADGGIQAGARSGSGACFQEPSAPAAPEARRDLEDEKRSDYGRTGGGEEGEQRRGRRDARARVLLRRRGSLGGRRRTRLRGRVRSAEVSRVVACHRRNMGTNQHPALDLEQARDERPTDRLGVVREGAATARAGALVRLRVEERRLAVARERVARVARRRRRDGVVRSRLNRRAVVAASDSRWISLRIQPSAKFGSSSRLPGEVLEAACVQQTRLR